MKAHLQEPVSLDVLAEESGQSRRTLERAFHKHLGMSPGQHYMNLRLDHAHQLLVQTSLSITQVAFGCGGQLRGIEGPQRRPRLQRRSHRFGAPGFGHDHDNFIGRLPQANQPAAGPGWAAFYRDRRLEAQLRMAADAGLASSEMKRGFARLFAELESLLGPSETPARLHGDLWGGNLMCDASGAPCLIDPAVYGGLSLNELESRIYGWAHALDISARCRQSNSEGEFIDWIHDAYDTVDGLIVNPGAWSHYSYAIRDALELLSVPFVEVHLSDIESREEWRRRSVVADLATHRVTGKGPDGYREALEFLAGTEAESG